MLCFSTFEIFSQQRMLRSKRHPRNTPIGLTKLRSARALIHRRRCCIYSISWGSSSVGWHGSFMAKAPIGGFRRALVWCSDSMMTVAGASVFVLFVLFVLLCCVVFGCSFSSLFSRVCLLRAFVVCVCVCGMLSARCVCVLCFVLFVCVAWGVLGGGGLHCTNRRRAV